MIDSFIFYILAEKEKYKRLSSVQDFGQARLDSAHITIKNNYCIVMNIAFGQEKYNVSNKLANTSVRAIFLTYC